MQFGVEYIGSFGLRAECNAVLKLDTGDMLPRASLWEPHGGQCLV